MAGLINLPMANSLVRELSARQELDIEPATHRRTLSYIVTNAKSGAINSDVCKTHVCIGQWWKKD